MAVLDAYQREYEVVLALDCTDSYDEEHHHISLRSLTRGICTGKTNQDIFDLLTSNPSLFFGSPLPHLYSTAQYLKDG